MKFFILSLTKINGLIGTVTFVSLFAPLLRFLVPLYLDLKELLNVRSEIEMETFPKAP